MAQEYSIWCDRYVADGDGHAVLLGTCLGRTFEDACKRFAKQDYNFGRHFDPETMSLRWSKKFPKHCWTKLFSNEKDAIDSFKGR